MSQTAESTTISVLPWNCIVRILQYIPLLERIKLRRVCKSWQKSIDHLWCTHKSLSINDDSEFSTVDLEEDTLVLSTRNFPLAEGVLTNCAPHLASLAISRRGNGPGDFPLLSVAEKCRHLKSLEIEISSEVHDGQLCVLLENNPNISRFHVYLGSSRCNKFFDYLPATLEDLGLCVRCAPALCFLFPLTHRAQINNLRQLIAKSTDLKKLLIDYSPPDIMAAVGAKRSLESLTICVSPMDTAYELSDDEPPKWSFLYNLKNLREIEVYGLTSIPRLGRDELPKQPITDDVVEQLVQHCVLLESVALSNWEDLTDRSIRALSSLQHLKELLISSMWSSQGVTDEYLAHFANIERLELAGCEAVLDSGVIRLLRDCQTIRFLGLVRTGVTGDTLKAAVEETTRRVNGIKLMVEVDGSRVDISSVENSSPLLQIIGF